MAYCRQELRTRAPAVGWLLESCPHRQPCTCPRACARRCRSWRISNVCQAPPGERAIAGAAPPWKHGEKPRARPCLAGGVEDGKRECRQTADPKCPWAEVSLDALAV